MKRINKDGLKEVYENHLTLKTCEGNKLVCSHCFEVYNLKGKYIKTVKEGYEGFLKKTKLAPGYFSPCENE